VAALLAPRRADTHKQDFVYGQGIDEIVALEQADVLDHDDDENTSELTRSFYHRNALGSVLEVTDALEVTVCSYRYDPYGAVTITVGGTPQGTDPLNQHWTFTGRFFDEETGFYYYRARAYDPATGRFLQRDPLGYEDSPGLYSYARLAPSVWRDAHGLRSHQDALADCLARALANHNERVAESEQLRDGEIKSAIARSGAAAVVAVLLGRTESEAEEALTTAALATAMGMSMRASATAILQAVGKVLGGAAQEPAVHSVSAANMVAGVAAEVEQAKKDHAERERASQETYDKEVDECWRNCYGASVYNTTEGMRLEFWSGGKRPRDMSPQELRRHLGPLWERQQDARDRGGQEGAQEAWESWKRERSPYERI
jgi:RHS repeat-associated protein